MNPAEILRKQGEILKRQDEALQKMRIDLDVLRESRKRDEEAIQALKIGGRFRDIVTRAAESIIPYHQIVSITIPAALTAQITQPILTSADGWFFADYVFASFRPTAGAAAGRYMPIGSSDPIIATAGAPPADRLDFMWGYSEQRTERVRQTQGQMIPGDLLYRNEAKNAGLLLGGDPWAPATTITVTVTPLVAPANAGILSFVFLGEQCLHTGGDLLDAWLTRKRAIGV